MYWYNSTVTLAASAVETGVVRLTAVSEFLLNGI